MVSRLKGKVEFGSILYTLVGIPDLLISVLFLDARSLL